MLGFRGWGLGLGPKAPSSGALLLQGAQVAEGPSAEAQQYPEPYSIQKPNSIHKLTAGARKKGAKRPEFLVVVYYIGYPKQIHCNQLQHATYLSLLPI